MGRVSNIKWEKSYPITPTHNIISSDFAKYQPQPWKFLEGDAIMSYVLSFEYQRMFIRERELWNKRMYPENIAVKVDLVKKYIQNLKTTSKAVKPPKKKPFKMKKFENIPSKTKSSRVKDENNKPE